MNMVMGFTSEDGRVYQLEYTGEISGSPHWVPSGSSVTGDGNIAEVVGTTEIGPDDMLVWGITERTQTDGGKETYG